MTTRTATLGIAPQFGLPRLPPAGPAQRLAGLAAAMLGKLRERDIHRRCLVQLDPHLLKDIGLTTRDQLRETSKPIWRA